MPVTSERSAQSTKQSVAANIKDTLESIVVAFILAFVFRAFIVEAFVIPTGSMAVTLYGAQLTNTCSTCGYEYALGISPEQEHANQYGKRLICPNCNMSTDEFTSSQVQSPDSGDRILVHKWPFDIGGKWLGPKRWDVTVFKDPRDGTTNFIKRLVGLPGEVLEIIDGDIYALPVEVLKAKRPELLAEFDELRKEVYRHGQSGVGFNNAPRPDLEDRYRKINDELLPFLVIQRKTPRAQQSLWFDVYDHDFLPNYDRLPADQSGQRVGWQPVGPLASQAWDTSKREITFQSDKGELLAIRFAGKPIDDFYAYNNDGVRVHGSPRRYLVGDLGLKFTWFPDAGDGNIILKMNHDQDVFSAYLHTNGTIRVEGINPGRQLPDDRQTIGEKKLSPFARDRAVKIEFIIVDYQISLLIDGKEEIKSTDAQYSPLPKNLKKLLAVHASEPDGAQSVEPSQVSIAARNIRCRFRHLRLQRDVYYRSQRQKQEKEIEDDAPLKINPYYDWPGWGVADCPILLRGGRFVNGKYYPAEYYMLGDNSPQSKDSRLWWEIGPHLLELGEEYKVGTVTEDQLIGKAFFVYWPAGYRPAWAGGIGLIPNFGRIRWIR